MKNVPAMIVILTIIVLAALPGCGPQAGPATQPPEKAKTVQQAPATDPAKAAEAEKFFAQGLKDYEQYKYREAVSAFDRAIAADPANYKVYTAKGITLCFQGDYKGGMALIQKTLAMKADYVPAFYDMAMAYKLQDDYDKSVYWFEKTIQGDPQNTWSYYGIATIHADRGNTQEALKYLKKAIELDQGVKAVAKRQDHFARMRSLPEFQALVR